MKKSYRVLNVLISTALLLIFAFEGHYWVDMRRYGKLNTLPVDRPGDDVWEKFPIPSL